MSYQVLRSYKVVGKVLRFMRSVVLMALDTKAAILCDVTPCRYPSSPWRNLLHSYLISRYRTHRVPRNHLCQSARCHIPGECNLKTFILKLQTEFKKTYISFLLFTVLPSECGMLQAQDGLVHKAYYRLYLWTFFPALVHKKVKHHV